MTPSYDPLLFEKLCQVEDRHFWFRLRNEVISRLASDVSAGWEPGYRVLEVGCGTGNVLRFLERACAAGRVTGMDLFAEGLRIAQGRSSCSLVRGDVHSPPLSCRFRLVGLFDVLEHLPNDEGTLRDLCSILEEDGVLLITVPAHMSLWSYFDQASHHCRRYSSKELRSKMEKAGFRIEFMSEFMSLLYPLLRLYRGWRSDARNGPTHNAHQKLLDEFRVVPVVNGVLRLLLRWEGWWMAGRRSLPFGSSLIAVARKA